MSRQQIEEISNLLLAYSAGDYDAKGSISEDVDELDMIISGINMLGEELRATNVSRDFFSGIFNSVSDFVFIVDDNGMIIEANRTVSDTFELPLNTLAGRPLQHFLDSEHAGFFEQVSKQLLSEKVVTTEVNLSAAGKPLIYGVCTATKLFDRYDKFNGYLVNIKDVTLQKEKENLILRTIISTQQNEQKRVADDLHDSLGQHLAMAQLMVTNLAKFHPEDEAHAKLVQTCKEILESSVKHIREICFDLMPSALVKGGLRQAVDELVLRLKNQDQISVNYLAEKDFPRIEADIEVACYRIVQEFLNNMMKHAKATVVDIVLKAQQQSIEVMLQDNGVGFDLAKLETLGENRGVRNIHSRVKAYGGWCELNSAPGKGTSLTLRFPVKK